MSTQHDVLESRFDVESAGTLGKKLNLVVLKCMGSFSKYLTTLKLSSGKLLV